MLLRNSVLWLIMGWCLFSVWVKPSKSAKRGDTMKVVATQVEAVLRAAGPERLANYVIAYEPVWAIGTG